MQHVGDHYNTGNTTSFHSMHFTPAAENTITTPSGPTTTSVLRSWRKKDVSEKQSSTSSSSSEAPSNAENQGPVARVAPHNHYPKPAAPPPPADIYRYPQQYGDFGAQNPSQIPAPVKYSEIIEPMQSIEQLTPILQKPKEKSYLEMCNVQQNHMKPYPDYQNYKQHYDGLKNYNHMPSYKQQYHPYLQKESQMSGYVQKETNIPPHYLHNYKMSPPNYPRNYPREGNDFLANLNKIAPDMAQDIINDPHLRDPHLREPQFPMYPAIDQNRLYQQQHQRMYQRSSPIQHPVQNYGQRNMTQNFNQYQMNQQRIPPDPYRMYPHQRYGQAEQIPTNISPRQYHENMMGFPPRISPNYPPCGQLEYAQHYQHRQVPIRQDFLPIPNKPFIEAHPEIPEIVPDESIHQSKKTLKAYLENWREEFTEEAETGEAITNDKIQLVKSSVPNKENTLYVLDAMEIPSENIPQYLHLQSIDKLPPNIRAFAYNAEETAIKQQNAIVISANVKSDETNKIAETPETKTKDNTYHLFHNKEERNAENAIYHPNMNLNSYKGEEIPIEDDRPACKLLQSIANARNANDRPMENQNAPVPDRDKIHRPCFAEPQKDVCRSLPPLITAESEIVKNEERLERAYSEIVDSILEDHSMKQPPGNSSEDNVPKIKEEKEGVSEVERQLLDEDDASANVSFHETELMKSLEMIERKSVIAENTLTQYLSNSKDAEASFSKYTSFGEKKNSTDTSPRHLSDNSKDVEENLLKYTMEFEEKNRENLTDTFKEKIEEFHDEERIITRISNEHSAEEKHEDSSNEDTNFKDLPALENPIDLSHHFDETQPSNDEAHSPNESHTENDEEECIKDVEENKHVYTDILMFKRELNLTQQSDKHFEEDDVNESNDVDAESCFNVEGEDQKNVVEEENVMEEQKNVMVDEKNVMEKEKNAMEEEKNTMEKERNAMEEGNVIEEENAMEEENVKIKQDPEGHQAEEIIAENLENNGSKEIGKEEDSNQGVENENFHKLNMETSDEEEIEEIQLPTNPSEQKFEEHNTESIKEASERENYDNSLETDNFEQNDDVPYEEEIQKVEDAHQESVILPETGNRSIDDFENEKQENMDIAVEDIAGKSINEKCIEEEELPKSIKVECNRDNFEEMRRDEKCEEIQKENIVELNIPDIKEDYDDDCEEISFMEGISLCENIEGLNEESDTSDEESDESQHGVETNTTAKENGDIDSKSFTFERAETNTEIPSSCENAETVFDEPAVAEKLENEIEKSSTIEENLEDADESADENSEEKRTEKSMDEALETNGVFESSVYQFLDEETSVCEENEQDEAFVSNLPEELASTAVAEDSNEVLYGDNMQETLNSNIFEDPESKEENNNDVFELSTSGSHKDEDCMYQEKFPDESEELFRGEATDFSYLHNDNASNGDSIILKGQNDEEEAPKEEIDSSYVIEIAKELLQINVTQDNGVKVISITPLTKVKVVTHPETIEKDFDKESEEIYEETQTELTDEDHNIEDGFEIEDTNEITNTTDETCEDQDILCTEVGVEEIEERSTDAIQITDVEHFEEVMEIVEETEILQENEVEAVSLNEDDQDAEEIVGNELIHEAELYLHNEVVIENKEDLNDAIPLDDGDDGDDEIKTTEEEEIKGENKEILEDVKEGKAINNNYIEQLSSLKSNEKMRDEEVEKRRKTDRLQKRLLKLKKLKESRGVNGKKLQLNPLRNFRKIKMKKSPNLNTKEHVVMRDNKRKKRSNFDLINIEKIKPMDNAEKTKIFSSIVVIDKISPESIKKITKRKHEEQKLTSKKSAKNKFIEQRLLSKHYSRMHKRQKEMARNMKKKKFWKGTDKNGERQIALGKEEMPSLEAKKDDDEDLPSIPNENTEKEEIFKIDDVSSDKTVAVDNMTLPHVENSGFNTLTEINDTNRVVDDTNTITENCNTPEVMDQIISEENPVSNGENSMELEENAKNASVADNPDAATSKTKNKFIKNSSAINSEASSNKNLQSPEILPIDSKPDQADKNLSENRTPETAKFLIPEGTRKNPLRNVGQGQKILEKYPRDLRRTKSANHFDQNNFHVKKRRLSLEEYNNRKRMLVKSTESLNVIREDVFPTVNADREKEKMVQEVLQSLNSEDMDLEEYGRDVSIESREKSILKVVVTPARDLVVAEKKHDGNDDENMGRKENVKSELDGNAAKIDNIAKIKHPIMEGDAKNSESFFKENVVKSTFPKTPIEEDVLKNSFLETNGMKKEEKSNLTFGGSVVEKNISKNAFPKTPIEVDLLKGNFIETNETKREEKSKSTFGGSVVEKNIIPEEKASNYATYSISDDVEILVKTPGTKSEEKYFDKFTIEEKLNSLQDFLPKIAPKDPTQIEISRKLEELLNENPISYTQKYSEVLLIKRFLKREDLTPEELKKIRQIVQCKRAFESIKSSATVDVTKRRHSSDFPKSIKIDFNDFDLKKPETEVVKNDNQNQNRPVCYNRSISAFVEEQLKKNCDGETSKRCIAVNTEDYSRTNANRNKEKLKINWEKDVDVQVETLQKLSRLSVIAEEMSKEKLVYESINYESLEENKERTSKPKDSAITKNKISKNTKENDKDIQSGKVLENPRKDSYKDVIISRLLPEKMIKEIFRNDIKKGNDQSEDEKGKVTNNSKVNEKSKEENEYGETKEGFSNTKMFGTRSGEIPKEEIHKITSPPKSFKHTIQNLIANENVERNPEQYSNTKLPGSPSCIAKNKSVCQTSADKAKKLSLEGLASVPAVEIHTERPNKNTENSKNLTPEKRRWKPGFETFSMAKNEDRPKIIKYSTTEAIYSKSKEFLRKENHTVLGLNIPGSFSKKNSHHQEFELKTSGEDHTSQNKFGEIPKRFSNFVKSIDVERNSGRFLTNAHSPTKMKHIENPIFDESFKRKSEIDRGERNIYRADFKAESTTDNQNTNKKCTKLSKITEKDRKETTAESTDVSETKNMIWLKKPNKIAEKKTSEKATISGKPAKKVSVEKNVKSDEVTLLASLNREKFKNVNPTLQPKFKIEHDNAFKVYAPTKDGTLSASGSNQSPRTNHQEACQSVLPKPISKTKAQLKSFQDQVVENKPISLDNKDQINSNISPVISNITKLTALLTYYKRGIETGADSANLKKIEEIMNQLSPNLKNLPNLPDANVSNEYEVSKPEAENHKLKLHLKKVQGENKKRKKRFRNLYTENESDEDGSPKTKEVKVEKYDVDSENLTDYSVYQRKCPAGVPKLVIKRRKSDFKLNVQPYVKLNRIAGIESMVRKRKRSILASQVFINN